ncbi:MAG TPA: putative Ig domain-containing protein [Longimicrobiales bacterium]|nr:putative Ig domain-containing protein [Longimicrobiales bacterium]
MRGIRKYWIALAVLLAACDDVTEPHEPQLKVENVVLEARGDTASLTALADGGSVVANWESLDPAIVEVTAGGLARAVAPGTARVRASFAGAADTGTVTVLPAVDIRVSGLSVVTDPTGEQGMRMRIRNDGGRGFFRLEFWRHDPDGSKRRILWYVNETEAEPELDVEHSNFLGGELAEWVVAYSREPLAEEPVRTSCARLDGATEPCPSDVVGPPAAVDSVLVTPAAAVVYAGDTIQYVARAFADDVELPGREVVWTTPSPDVISLSATGRAIALRPGYGQVNATVEGVTVAVGLTVASESPGNTLSVSPNNLPAASQGRVYAAHLLATGGDGVYVWSLESGTLPTGMTLAGDGALTGIPAEGGTFTFTVRVTDGAARTAVRGLTLIVNRVPTIAVSSLPPGQPGEAYAAQLMATGGTGTYTWSVVGGALPDGLTLSAGGSITGTPTSVGSTTFTVWVTDEASVTHSREFTIVVAQVAVLVSGNPATGIGGIAGSERYYGIVVPSGAPRLTVSISGGTGDVDLYVRHGDLPMAYVYDCRPLRAGNDETCTFTAPASGHWYIMLRGHAAYADVSLTASHDG